MKNIYFLSDAHLGSWGIPHPRTQERRLVRFLDSIKDKAAAIYLLGDMFDFWYEYKYVVPRGYDYLERECGVILHKQPLTTELYGKIFFLAHGDGLGDPSKVFKLLRWVFHNRLCQVGFSAIHPRWALWLGNKWARHSYLKHKDTGVPPYMGPEKEYLVRYTRQYMQNHPNIDYYIYGHRHIELDLQLTKKARVMILGDWISQFSYAIYDGEHMFMEEYIEGESQP